MATKALVVEKPQGRKAGVHAIPQDLPVLLDPSQCAGIASTSAKFIRDRCADGSIKAVKVGRIWRVNRDSFLEQFGLRGDDAYVG